MEQVKRKHAFDYQITCESEEMKSLFIPTLVIQNIVENSIKHGTRENRRGLFNITFALKDNDVLCTVHDNGNGFNPSDINKETSKGFQLLKRKLHIVENLIGHSIQFSFSNRYDKHQNIIGTRPFSHSQSLHLTMIFTAVIIDDD